jgi:hypothetical protein
LTVDFVVCTLAVKKKIQGRFRYVGSDHSLVRPGIAIRYSNGLRAGQTEFNSWQEREIFLYSSASRPTMGTTKPPIQWVPELFPRE